MARLRNQGHCEGPAPAFAGASSVAERMRLSSVWWMVLTQAGVRDDFLEGVRWM